MYASVCNIACQLGTLCLQVCVTLTFASWVCCFCVCVTLTLLPAGYVVFAGVCNIDVVCQLGMLCLRVCVTLTLRVAGENFEDLSVASLSTPPELPDVMKPQESSSSHTQEQVTA